MFKKGDKVVCVYNEYYEDELTIGKLYTVTYSDKDTTRILGHTDYFLNERWKLPETEIVKSIMAKYAS